MEHEAQRAKAAQRLLRDPTFREAIETIKQSKRDEIEASSLPDALAREMCFLQIRGLTEIMGQLEAWARDVEGQGTRG